MSQRPIGRLWDEYEDRFEARPPIQVGMDPEFYRETIEKALSTGAVVDLWPELPISPEVIY